MPTKKPARITEIALAPTAGAKGVDPDDPAPMAHAMNRLAPPAATNVATVNASIEYGYTGNPYKYPLNAPPWTRNAFTARGRSQRVTDEAYLTLANRATARFTVQGSEFIGHAAPVDSVAAAEAFVEEIEAEHPDATHNVPAYRVRADPFREYASDDGEPSGSAGKPMLSVLSGQELENVAVVVTRYYGGTNLGVGGLVRAYSQATKDAVEAAGTVEERPHETVVAVIDYDDSGTVRGILESESLEFDGEYGESVRFEIRVPVAEADALRDRLRSATSGRIEL
jgi:uncharacterized YigZ family protein